MPRLLRSASTKYIRYGTPAQRGPEKSKLTHVGKLTADSSASARSFDMCHHVKYRFTQCRNSDLFFRQATNNPFCIRPCPKVFNNKGEVDHIEIALCEDYTYETIQIRSGCTWRGRTFRCCLCAELGPLPPQDDRFLYLIEQRSEFTGACFNSNLPKLEEMTWYVPDVLMDDSMFRPEFSWTASRNRKRETSSNNAPFEVEDEAYYLQGSEPLSPRSLPAPFKPIVQSEPAKVTNDPSTTTIPQSEPGWLTRTYSRTLSKKHTSKLPVLISAPTNASKSVPANAPEPEPEPKSPPVIPSTYPSRPPLRSFDRPITQARGLPNGAHSQHVSQTRVVLEEGGNARAAAFRPGFRFRPALCGPLRSRGRRDSEEVETEAEKKERKEYPRLRARKKQA